MSAVIFWIVVAAAVISFVLATGLMIVSGLGHHRRQAQLRSSGAPHARGTASSRRRMVRLEHVRPR